MQDRFRFRTWHKPTNTMEYNGLWSGRDWDKKIADCNIVIMQCTGLKDKNGKLIYEGDIVRDKHSEAVAIIEWLSYAYSLMAHIRRMDDYLPLEDICFACEASTPFEVIGNIYENPDLLEG